MKKILASFLVLAAASCSSDDAQNYRDDFAGTYKITAIQAATAVDLNNDGIESTDILLELVSPHTTLDGVFSGFYNPESPQNFAQARAGTHGAGDSLLSFNFPEQTISYLNFDMALNIPLLLEYTTSMKTYRYAVQENGHVKVIDLNPAFNAQFGEVIGIARDSEQHFSLALKKRMFNFSTKQWMLLDLTATYAKI